MPKRKKHPRLPSGFGSIRFLGSGRALPYAVHPPAKERDENGNYIRPKALCYVQDWYTGFAILTSYHAGTYTPGMEYKMANRQPVVDLDVFCHNILRDFAIASHTVNSSQVSLDEVYKLFYEWKYGEKAAKQLSTASRTSTKAAYLHLEQFYERPLDSISLTEMQDYINSIDASKSTVANVVQLLKSIYKYALPRELCTKNIAQHLVMPKTKDVEHGTPFTDTELLRMWKGRSDSINRLLLIMCYSGFRISAYTTLTVNLEEGYFQGGVKTAAGKNRVVPIHSGIRPLVEESIAMYGHLIPGLSIGQTREKISMMYPGHTPHDTRHTFSSLCEKYGVAEHDRKRMLGHSFGADITNGVYGHRTVEELREQIEKIQFVSICD